MLGRFVTDGLKLCLFDKFVWIDFRCEDLLHKFQGNIMIFYSYPVLIFLKVALTCNDKNKNNILMNDLNLIRIYVDKVIKG